MKEEAKDKVCSGTSEGDRERKCVHACVEKKRNQIAINIFPFFFLTCRLVPLPTHVKEKYASPFYRAQHTKKLKCLWIYTGADSIEGIVIDIGIVIANLSSTCVYQSFFFLVTLFVSDLLPPPATPLYSPLFAKLWFRLLISGLFFPFTVVTRFEDSKAFRQCSYLRGHYISYIKAIDRLNTRIKRKQNPPDLKRMFTNEVYEREKQAFRLHDHRHRCRHCRLSRLETMANAMIVDSVEAAGCLRKLIYLFVIHINCGHLARNVQ